MLFAIDRGVARANLIAEDLERHRLLSDEDGDLPRVASEVPYHCFGGVRYEQHLHGYIALGYRLVRHFCTVLVLYIFSIYVQHRLGSFGNSDRRGDWEIGVFPTLLYISLNAAAGVQGRSGRIPLERRCRRTRRSSSGERFC